MRGGNPRIATAPSDSPNRITKLASRLILVAMAKPFWTAFNSCEGNGRRRARSPGVRLQFLSVRRAQQSCPRPWELLGPEDGAQIRGRHHRSSARSGVRKVRLISHYPRPLGLIEQHARPALDRTDQCHSSEAGHRASAATEDDRVCEPRHGLRGGGGKWRAGRARPKCLAELRPPRLGNKVWGAVLASTNLEKNNL